MTHWSMRRGVVHVRTFSAARNRTMHQVEINKVIGEHVTLTAPFCPFASTTSTTLLTSPTKPMGGNNGSLKKATNANAAVATALTPYFCYWRV